MDYTQIKARLVNPNDKAFYSNRYAIYNEFGPIAFVYANCEQDALDEAVDAGRLDSDMLTPDELAECLDNGWDDEVMYLGNASEPFRSPYLSISEV
mgnify:CR=1 FL=1